MSIPARSIAILIFWSLENGDGALLGERALLAGGVVITTSLGVDIDIGENTEGVGARAPEDRRVPYGIFQFRNLNEVRNSFIISAVD